MYNSCHTSTISQYNTVTVYDVIQNFMFINIPDIIWIYGYGIISEFKVCMPTLDILKL